MAQIMQRKENANVVSKLGVANRTNTERKIKWKQ